MDFVRFRWILADRQRSRNVCTQDPSRQAIYPGLGSFDVPFLKSNEIQRNTTKYKSPLNHIEDDHIETLKSAKQLDNSDGRHDRSEGVLPPERIMSFLRVGACVGMPLCPAPRPEIGLWEIALGDSFGR